MIYEGLKQAATRVAEWRTGRGLPLSPEKSFSLERRFHRRDRQAAMAAPHCARWSIAWRCGQQGWPTGAGIAAACGVFNVVGGNQTPAARSGLLRSDG